VPRLLVLLALTGFSWWVSGFAPYTWGIHAGVLLPGVLLLAFGLALDRSRGREDGRRARAPGDGSFELPAAAGHPSHRRTVSGLVVWTSLAAAIVGFQLYNFFSQPRSHHPTVSEMVNTIDASHPARMVVLIAWFVLGWDLVRR
jgi:hypothetical protein